MPTLVDGSLGGTVIALSHLGICVTDLEIATRFYVDGLGFDQAERHEVGDAFAGLMELDAVTLTSQFLRRDQVAIELLCFEKPLASIEARRPIPTAGLTHLSFRVDDLDEELDRLVGLGGTVIEGTRTELADGALRFIYLTDPDGTRIELMELP